MKIQICISRPPSGGVPHLRKLKNFAPRPRFRHTARRRLHNAVPASYSVRARSAMFWWKLMILCSYS